MQSVLWYPGTSLETVERQIIHEALKFYKNNKTATAQSLGIAVRTLDAKIDKYAADQTAEDARKLQAEKDRQEWSLRHRGLLAPVNGKTTPKVDEAARAIAAQTPIGVPLVTPSPSGLGQAVYGVAAKEPPDDLTLTPQTDGELDDLIGGAEVVETKPVPAMPPTPTQRRMETPHAPKHAARR